MERRALTFDSYEAVIAEIDQLQRGGYDAIGNWSLGQTCRHLAFYYRGSLDGFGFRLPWLVRKLIGRPLLRRILQRGSMKPGGPTVPASVPQELPDEQAAIDDAEELLQRLATAKALHPSPIFEQLTVDQWRTLHLIHSAHHLSFLVPRSAAEPPAGIPADEFE